MTPKLYSSLLHWKQQCENIAGDKEMLAPSVTAEDEIEAVINPTTAPGWWAIVNELMPALGQGERKVQRVEPAQERMLQMSEAIDRVVTQTGLKARRVDHAGGIDLRGLSLKAFEEELGKLLQTDAAQLVRLQESFDEVMQCIKEGTRQEADQSIDRFLEMLDDIYTDFCTLSENDSDAEKFQQFSSTLNQWMLEEQTQLSAARYIPQKTILAFEKLQNGCLGFLYTAGTKAESPRPQEPAIQTQEQLIQACDETAQKIKDPACHGPKLQQEIQQLAQALNHLLAQGSNEEAQSLVAVTRGKYHKMLHLAEKGGFGMALAGTLDPLFQEIMRAEALYEPAFEDDGEQADPLYPLQDSGDEDTPLQSLSSRTILAQPQSLGPLGDQQPPRLEYARQQIPGGLGRFIPVNNDNMDYYNLCNEPEFAKTDFEYLRSGDYQIHTRTAYGPTFRHDRIVAKGDIKWKIHISIDREDLDKAFPIIRDWIMDPQSRMFAAKFIGQQTRDSEDQIGKEVTLYLYEDDEYANKDTQHWQNKLKQLEQALNRAGIHPGPRPLPEGHKFDTAVAGSQFFNYRNEAVRVEDRMAFEGPDRRFYEELYDPVTGTPYFRHKEFHDNLVILRETFNALPVAQRHNPLPGLFDDYLQGVDLTPAAKAPGSTSQRPARPAPDQEVELKPRPAPWWLQNKLQKELTEIRKEYPEMTTERLLTLLSDPADGGYDWLQDDYFHYIGLPVGPITKYLHLQEQLPDAFPDNGFFRAWNQGLVLFYYDMPTGQAYQEWVEDAAQTMTRDRRARAQLNALPMLQALMPDSGNFRTFMDREAPGFEIPEELLSQYRQHLEEEFYLHLMNYEEGLTDQTAWQIFAECKNELLDHLVPERYENKSRDQFNKYTTQNFSWIQHDRTPYRPKTAMGFIAYSDPEAEKMLPKSNTGRWLDEGTAHKFRISIHPHDYEKAWDAIAEILHRPDCPFPIWKTTYPWKHSVGKAHSRLKIGGQFTLYSLNAPDNPQVPERFNEENISRTLREIEAVLRDKKIRPGRQPKSDVYFGDNHPYVSYRYDMDKTNSYYQPAATVTHQRRTEYREMPRYRRVSRHMGHRL